MKTDRHKLPERKRNVKHRWPLFQGVFSVVCVLLAVWICLPKNSAAKLGAKKSDNTLPATATLAAASSEPPTIPVGGQVTSGQVTSGQATTHQQPANQVAQSGAASPAEPQSDQQAKTLIREVINRLANGDAFDAKVRQRVWTAGREVVGVGTYIQAGGGTGRFNLQFTMHDGDGKHTLQQICDGRLAWTRTEIADHVSLRRVDVGRLNGSLINYQTNSATSIPPRLRVGAWTEMLDSVRRDYVLRLGTSQLQSRRVWVIRGNLSESARRRILTESRSKKLPELFPTRVNVAIADQPDPATGFGQGLPVRLEFWSDTIATAKSPSASEKDGRLVSLMELYSMRPIQAPPVERFRFDQQEAPVNFVNETDRYLRRFGIRMTDNQRNRRRR